MWIYHRGHRDRSTEFTEEGRVQERERETIKETQRERRVGWSSWECEEGACGFITRAQRSDHRGHREG